MLTIKKAAPSVMREQPFLCYAFAFFNLIIICIKLGIMMQNEKPTA